MMAMEKTSDKDKAAEKQPETSDKDKAATPAPVPTVDLSKLTAEAAASLLRSVFTASKMPAWPRRPANTPIDFARINHGAEGINFTTFDERTIVFDSNIEVPGGETHAAGTCRIAKTAELSGSFCGMYKNDILQPDEKEGDRKPLCHQWRAEDTARWIEANPNAKPDGLPDAIRQKFAATQE